MNIEVEHPSPVLVRIHVEVPAERAEAELTDAARRLSRTAKIPGFRPGKIPLAQIKRRYAGELREKVVGLLANEAVDSAEGLQDQKVVGRPVLTIERFQAGEPLLLSVELNVIPQFELAPFHEIAVEMDAFTVPDPGLEHELERLLERVERYEPISDRDVAEQGDRVTLNFVGRINGKPFDGGTAEGFKLVLGARQMLPGFEEGIIGLRVGEQRVVSARFPARYEPKALAGRQADFEITLLSLERQVPAVLDDEVANELGVPNVEALREGVRESIAKRANEGARDRARLEIKARLASMYDFPLPEPLVAAHRRAVVKEQLTQWAQQRVPADEQRARLSENADAVNEKAASAARVSLVLDEIAQRQDLSVGDRELFAFINRMIQAMGQYGDRMRGVYEDENRREELRHRLLHDKALDFALSQANVTTVAREVEPHVHDHDDHGDHDDHAHGEAHDCGDPDCGHGADDGE